MVLNGMSLKNNEVQNRGIGGDTTKILDRLDTINKSIKKSIYYDRNK